MVRIDDIEAPGLQLTQIPVNPTDPILKVNGQVITRQQLADECIARKGKEIAEILIHRTLVEQALRAKRLEVTAAEIDQEIETVAKRFGISREGWLRTLDKSAGSPRCSMPGTSSTLRCVRKLCAGRVQVTPKDMKDAFEAQYAEKIRCRMILVDTQSKAMGIWEATAENPGGSRIATDQSMDAGSRSLGGLLAEPITRHTYPQTISTRRSSNWSTATRPTKTRATGPKTAASRARSRSARRFGSSFDGSHSFPPRPDVDPKNEQVMKQTREMICEVEFKETMGVVMQELMKAAPSRTS